MREKRTNWDFSKHKHRVEIFKNDEGKEIQIDHFQDGNSRVGYIQFINTDEIMSVTGDFGNWIFCRPFVPSSEGYVSDIYWCEKLLIASHQRYSSFDTTLTDEALNEELSKIDDEFDADDVERKEEYKEYLDGCIRHSENEHEYITYAYQEHPSWMDSESVIYCEKTSVQLEIIFDAFDEICKRLELKERITPKHITELSDNQIFVFGSNLSGRHGAGAVKNALDWGAIYGQAEGLQGKTYAIPTKDKSIQNTLSLDDIRIYVNNFIKYATLNPNLSFLVTPIGYGLAGLKFKEIASLFENATYLKNVCLPIEFWKVLKEKTTSV